MKFDTHEIYNSEPDFTKIFIFNIMNSNRDNERYWGSVGNWFWWIASDCYHVVDLKVRDVMGKSIEQWEF